MHRRVHAVGMSLLLAMSISPARAQDETKPKQDERIVTATNLVTVNVIVTDRNGKYVKGLGRNQFEVYDEGVKQRIAHFINEPGPVSLGIVCEIHNSTPEEKTRAMLTALKQFTHGLRSDDDFFFTAFGAQGSVTAGFVPTADQVLDHLEIVQPGGPSSFYDAIFTAAERLRRGRHLKKALIVVSDGDDDKSRTSYDQLRERLKEFDVQIYAISISNPASAQFANHSRWHFEDITRQTTRRRFLLNDKDSIGRTVLAELARVSGGASYFPESENEPELLWICARIALELREQYTLGFYPTEQIEKKSWRRIQVKVKTGRESRGLVLSYRRGYRRTNQQVGYLPISLSPL